MVYETNNENEQQPTRLEEITPAPAPAPVGATIAGSIVLTQRAAAVLRAYLNEHELGHYRIFRCEDDNIFNAEWCLDELGESQPAASWEGLPALIAGGETIARLSYEESVGPLFEGGALHLARHEAVLARWSWVDPDNYSETRTLQLVAARSERDVTRLRDDVARHRRAAQEAKWQIVRGISSRDGAPQPRGEVETLLLDAKIRQRVEAEIVRFFSSKVAELYRSMNVPYRRGVLLHGPPGNGKTSLIRHIGARLPAVPAMLMRPGADFDSDDLEEVIRRWSKQAPAILVIEDLDWLLEKVNISTFLNLLDGVDRPKRGGLLLIATTNHPEKLDPAVNNRPGRFDVVLRIPPPGRTLRLEFLRRVLPTVSDGLIAKIASRAEGMSFAHLEEIARLSGLSAIHAGRAERSEGDLLDAVEAMRGTCDQAERGFPDEPEQAFGLLPLRDRRANKL
jgi:hypothetical protein